MARLIAKIFQHADYGGQYRWITRDVANFVNDIGFNDTVSSIRVFCGNDYEEGDTIRFHEHVGFGGGYLDLGPGFYPNIHIQPFSFGDKISSADIRRGVDNDRQITVFLMVRIYKHINFRGQYRDLIRSESNLNNVGFNDTVSSIRVFRGEDYNVEDPFVCDFYQHADRSGGQLAPGQFEAGMNLANIAEPPFSFNDRISSVQMHRPR